jgi:DNA-binding response OmpR family regulator
VKTKRSVLLIDDDAALREALASALADEGYSVHQAGNAADAKSWLARKAPDLIVVDVMMPDLNGIEFCRWLRSWGKLKATPVLMMSGLKDEETVQDALELGVADFLRKPFAAKALLEKAAVLLTPRGD